MLFPADCADRDVLLFELWQCGTAGIIEEDVGLRAFFEDSVDPACLEVIAAAGVLRQESSTNDRPPNLIAEPIPVGQRWLICDAYDSSPTPKGRMRLEVSGTTAFGTGRHESTQLCLEALENLPVAGCTVVDVGCGSGILSRAAHRLRAARIISCDIHEEAVTATRKHMSSLVYLGSADALADGCADFVFANISALVLDALAFDLKRITKPQGKLVLAGFLREKPPRFFRPETSSEREAWLCWICTPAGISPPENGPSMLVHSSDWWL